MCSKEVPVDTKSASLQQRIRDQCAHTKLISLIRNHSLSSPCSWILDPPLTDKDMLSMMQSGIKQYTYHAWARTSLPGRHSGTPEFGRNPSPNPLLWSNSDGHNTEDLRDCSDSYGTFNQKSEGESYMTWSHSRTLSYVRNLNVSQDSKPLARASMSTHQTPSSTINLPRELRDKIYRELLVPKKIRDPTEDMPRYALEPAILQLKSRPTRRMRMFYTGRTFRSCFKFLTKNTSAHSMNPDSAASSHQTSTLSLVYLHS